MKLFKKLIPLLVGLCTTAGLYLLANWPPFAAFCLGLIAWFVCREIMLIRSGAKLTVKMAPNMAHYNVQDDESFDMGYRSFYPGQAHSPHLPYYCSDKYWPGGDY